MAAQTVKRPVPQPLPLSYGFISITVRTFSTPCDPTFEKVNFSPLMCVCLGRVLGGPLGRVRAVRIHPRAGRERTDAQYRVSEAPHTQRVGWAMVAQWSARCMAGVSAREVASALVMALTALVVVENALVVTLRV